MLHVFFLAIVGILAASSERPNVVLIVVDDQGFADVGYNNDAVHSPRIDALARGGLVFEQNYVMPQCTPTRVALMTGRYPSRFGGPAQQASNEPAFPLGTPTLASVLQAAGYHTAIAGKWHLGSAPAHGPNHFGFDSSYGSLAGAVGMYDHRYRSGPFEPTWHRDHAPIEGAENGVHATDLVAREAIRVIESADDQPFFLYLPFHAVHTPLDERGRFTDRPTQLDPDRPGRWLNEDDIPWFHDPEGRIQREPDPERRLFLAATHHLDHAIGEIVDALERTGARENTVIVYTSDNGPQVDWGGRAYPDDLRLTDFNQPCELRGRKIDVWDGGVRVPGFINWPGRIDPGVAAETPVHAVDWLPTLASLVEAEPPDGLDGVDVSGLFNGGSPPTRELYWMWGRAPNRWALRHGDWKIVAYGAAPNATDDWALFDLDGDPNEREDVAAAHPAIVADLHRRFLRQRELDAK